RRGVRIVRSGRGLHRPTAAERRTADVVNEIPKVIARDLGSRNRPAQTRVDVVGQTLVVALLLEGIGCRQDAQVTNPRGTHEHTERWPRPPWEDGHRSDIPDVVASRVRRFVYRAPSRPITLGSSAHRVRWLQRAPRVDANLGSPRRDDPRL